MFTAGWLSWYIEKMLEPTIFLSDITTSLLLCDVPSHSEDLHQVTRRITTSQVETENTVRQGPTVCDTPSLEYITMPVVRPEVDRDERRDRLDRQVHGGPLNVKTCSASCIQLEHQQFCRRTVLGALLVCLDR